MSEYLIEIINEMILEWDISDKHIIFVTDNASDIRKAICDLGKSNSATRMLKGGMLFYFEKTLSS